MTIPITTFEQMASMYKVEQDWLFEKLLLNLNTNRHVMLAAKQGWGIKEYVKELGFQLEEKSPDIHICYLDMKPVYTTTSFLEYFAAALVQKFPEETSRIVINKCSIDVLKLPALIAKKRKANVAVFLANAHLLQRFRNCGSFLRMLKLRLKNQKNCIFCLYGNSTQQFRDLVKYPGPLSGLGQWYELKHNPVEHRSASIRKLFHDHGKRIGYSTSIRMSFMANNNPFYLKLLAWHALIRTRYTCNEAILENAMNDLIHHFDLHFHKIAESLTQKQLSLLKALIEGNRQLYSNATRMTYHLGTSGHITRIKSSLEKKDIIDTRNMEIEFTNPLFREWLRRFCFA